MLHQVSSIQKAFLQFLRDNLEAGLYEMWFDGQFQLFGGETADALYITANTAFVADWYRQNFQDIFHRAIHALMPSFSGKIYIYTPQQIQQLTQENVFPELGSFPVPTPKQNSKKKMASVVTSGQVSTFTSNPAPTGATRSEQLALRKQASRDILSATRRANLPDVLAFLEGMESKSCEPIQGRTLPVGKSPTPLVQKSCASRKKVVSCPPSKVEETNFVPVWNNTTSVAVSKSRYENEPKKSLMSDSGSMADFLYLMDQMHAEGKIQCSLVKTETPMVAKAQTTEIRVVTELEKKRKSTKKATQGSGSKPSEIGTGTLKDLMAKVMEFSTAEESQPSTQPVSQGTFQTARFELSKSSRRGYVGSTFDTFVSGASNRTAFTTARGIFQRLGCVSPILFTGGTGTGKTHLLNAIFNHALELGISAVYKTSEDFITEFVEGLRDPKKKSEFQIHYRQCDVLVLDNLQTLLNKTVTAQELRTIIAYRIRQGKQVVLATDRSLKELAGLGPEFCSQLEGGYVCHISEPSYDVRLGILNQENQIRQLSLTDAQRQKLALQYEGDARAILGALNTLEMKVRTQMQFRSEESETMSTQERTTILQQLVDGMAKQPSQIIRLEDIKRYVSLLFGIDITLLSSGKRERKVSQPRMLAMWLARKFTRKSLAEIGHAFGCSSHSTVISAQKKVEQWRTQDFRLQTLESVQNINDLLYQLESQLQRAL